MEVRDLINRKAYSSGIATNPLISQASLFFLPNNWRDAIKQCVFYYLRDEDVNACINKMAEYPVTSIITPDEEDGGNHVSKTMAILRKMQIMDNLKKLNTEFLSQGNVVIGFNVPFKRKLKCPSCKTEHEFKKVDFDYKNGDFEGKCPKCGAGKVKFGIKDTVDKAGTPNLVFYDITDFKIVYNPFTGKKIYYYTIPKRTKKYLSSSNDKEFIEGVPKIFLDAIKLNKRMKFDEQSIFHAHTPTISGDRMFEGVGVPVIFPVLRTLFLKSLLMKADETNASGRLTGAEYVAPDFPGEKGASANGLQIPYSNFKEKVEEAIEMNRRSPNGIAVFPTPVRYGRIGGEGKMFLCLNELELLSQKIINGLQVPMEFIKGGLTWSGSSVSLRILENKFLNLREANLRFLNDFVMKKVSAYTGMKQVEVKLKDFKMADDIQSRQLDEALMDKEIIAPSTYCSKYGFDYAKEQRQIVLDSKYRRPASLSISRNRAIQTRVMVEEEIKGQIKANKMKAELNMMNEDSSNRIKNMRVTPEEYLQWKENGFNMGGLINGKDAELDLMKQQAKLQMEIQNEMQNAQMSQNPSQGDGTPVEEHGQEMLGEVQKYIMMLSEQGMEYSEIEEELLAQGVSQEMVSQALATLPEQTDGEAVLTEEKVMFIFEKASEMRLENRDEDIKKFLYGAGIPEKMVEEIFSKMDSVEQEITLKIKEGISLENIALEYEESTDVPFEVAQNIIKRIEKEATSELPYPMKYLVERFDELINGKESDETSAFFEDAETKLSEMKRQEILRLLEVYKVISEHLEEVGDVRELLKIIIESGAYSEGDEEFIQLSYQFLLNQKIEIPDYNEKLKEMENLNKTNNSSTVDMRPAPEQKPPRREG